MIDKSNPKYKQLILVSNPWTVQRRAKEQGYDQVYISTRKDKKYMVMNPETNKYSHFGAMSYQDFTFHQDNERRSRYLKRASKIHGSWEKNRWSPNYLSIHLLW